MTVEKVKRFTPVEVVYHVLHAVLYLILFATGSVLFLQRLLEFQWISPVVLSEIHRPTGILLIVLMVQTALISVFSVSFRSLWLSVREALHWQRSDLIWLIKMPFHVIYHKITLPPASRFNAGQKLHLLIIFLVLIGFSVSGIWMMVIPGALASWVVHLVCFIPAAFFLALHVFLSLVNPPTRPSLTGMITGYVSRAYAEEHHPLWMKTNRPAVHTVHIYRWPILVCTILIGVVASLGIWKYGPDKFKSQIIKIVRHQGREAILPGAITRSHRDHPDAQLCGSCHRKWSAPSSEKCLHCHENIQLVMAEQRGYHGTLEGPCSHCHQEHQGMDAELRSLDPIEFNHDQARFKLHGKHRTLECVLCHHRVKNDRQWEGAFAPGDIQYIGLTFEHCLDCHADPHNEQFEKPCSFCHSEQGWQKPMLYDAHGPQSKYPLVGKHNEVPCVKCHEPPQEDGKGAQARFANIPHDCRQCHTDPHENQMSSSCETCHIERGWQGENVIFDHNQHSAFKLDPLHSKYDCHFCHTGEKTVRYRPLPQTCETCHVTPLNYMKGIASSLTGNPDPHFGRVTCLDCHDVEAATESSARYAARCASCHNDHYRDLFYQWSSTWQSQKNSIETLLKNMDIKPEADKQSIRTASQEARSVHFHNIELSQILWRAIEKPPFPVGRAKQIIRKD